MNGEISYRDQNRFFVPAANVYIYIYIYDIYIYLFIYLFIYFCWPL